MSNQLICIDLKLHLVDFLRHVFNSPQGPIVIHRKYDIGKVITSLVRESEYPVSPRIHKSKCEILLPQNSSADLSTKFLYIDAWGEKQIQDYITAEFNMKAKLFFEVGYTLFNYEQQHIAEGFLTAYRIKENHLSMAAVIKNDFRKRKRTKEEIANQLQQFV